MRHFFIVTLNEPFLLHPTRSATATGNLSTCVSKIPCLRKECKKRNITVHLMNNICHFQATFVVYSRLINN
jgi:hypothetical protein